MALEASYECQYIVTINFMDMFPCIQLVINNPNLVSAIYNLCSHIGTIEYIVSKITAN